MTRRDPTFRLLRHPVGSAKLRYLQFWLMVLAFHAGGLLAGPLRSPLLLDLVP